MIFYSYFQMIHPSNQIIHFFILQPEDGFAETTIVPKRRSFSVNVNNLPKEEQSTNRLVINGE